MSTISQSLKIAKTLIFVLAINFNAFNQEISKISEIYDYEIGDIFHVTYWGSSYMGGFSQRCNFEIIDKYYSQANDTLFYVRDVAWIYIDQSGTTYSYIIDTVYFTNLDSDINGGNIDTVYSNPALYNGSLINYVECYNCYWDYEEKSFIVGCGGPYTYYYINDPPFEFLEGGIDLIYFLKGDEEWGEPYYVSIPETNTTHQFNLRVYPNPTKDFINIDLNTFSINPIAVTILSILGNSIKFVNYESVQSGRINVSNLPEGIYFIKVEIENNILIGKFLKE